MSHAPCLAVSCVGIRVLAHHYNPSLASHIHPFFLTTGFISIPHDFSISDLKPRLQALLGSGGGAGGRHAGIADSTDELSVFSTINGGGEAYATNGGSSGGSANGSSTNGSTSTNGGFGSGSYTNGAGAKQGSFATAGSSSGGYSGGGSSGKGFGRDTSSNRGSSYRRSGRDNGRAEGAGSYAGSSRGSSVSALGSAAGSAPAAGAAVLHAGMQWQRVRQAAAPLPRRQAGVMAAARPTARQPAVAARVLL